MPTDFTSFTLILSKELRHLAAAGYVNEAAGGPFLSPFYQAMADGVSTIPYRVHAFLHQAGHAIELCDLLVNVTPGLKGQRPWGWPVGTTWEQVPAKYDGQYHLAQVAAFVVDPVGGLLPSAVTAGGLREEIGHSVDDALGLVSHTPEFLDAYRTDVARIGAQSTQAERDLLAYVLMIAHGGDQATDTDAAEEVFSLLFAGEHGGSGDAPAFDRLLRQSFLECWKVMTRALTTIP